MLESVVRQAPKRTFAARVGAQVEAGKRELVDSVAFEARSGECSLVVEPLVGGAFEARSGECTLAVEPSVGAFEARDFVVEPHARNEEGPGAADLVAAAHTEGAAHTEAAGRIEVVAHIEAVGHTAQAEHNAVGCSEVVEKPESTTENSGRHCSQVDFAIVADCSVVESASERLRAAVAQILCNEAPVKSKHVPSPRYFPSFLLILSQLLFS